MSALAPKIDALLRRTAEEISRLRAEHDGEADERNHMAMATRVVMAWDGVSGNGETYMTPGWAFTSDTPYWIASALAMYASNDIDQTMGFDPDYREEES